MVDRRSFAERFWSRVDRSGPCWVWNGKVDRAGYAMPLHNRGLRYRPHQWAYILTHGPVPPRLELDHLCNVKACCNPAHLEAVTHKENLRRKRLHHTHCRHGHPFSVENTTIVYRDDGKRYERRCRICEKERSRRFRERHPGYFSRYSGRGRAA